MVGIKSMEYDQKNGEIRIILNAKGDGEPSKSGKSKVLASTGGFVMVGPGKVSLNLIK